MKPLLIVLGYLLSTVLLGALLAPPLFWLVKAAEPWALANGLVTFVPQGDEVQVSGVLAAVFTADFVKISHRAVLIAALLLLPPAIRALRVRGRADLRLRPDPRAGRHFLRGFLVAGGAVALMAAGYLLRNVYHLKHTLPWGELPRLAITAAAVALIEEALFRGAILGMFLRSMRPRVALAWTTLIFALLHYLRPEQGAAERHPGWLSGFVLLPQLFHLFAEPVMLLASLSTLLVFGWMLGYVRLRTGSLWMSIGIHAGVVFTKMTFTKFARRDALYLPWVGPELQIGLVPVALLLAVLLLLWLRLEHEELLPDPRPRA